MTDSITNINDKKDFPTSVPGILKDEEKYQNGGNSEKTVLDAELNSRPNYSARNLDNNKFDSIGIVIPDISNPFFAYLTRSIHNYAHKFGYSIIVCDTNENLELEIKHLELLLTKGIAGFIIMPVGQRYDHIESALKAGLPMVLLDRYFDNLDACSVLVDNYKGAYDAAEYMIRCGHTRIAIIQGLPDTNTSKDRLRGYTDAFEKNGIPIDKRLIVGNDFRKENGYVEAKILLNNANPPTAIFATSDLITLGVLQAIYEEKKNIPEDISLIAFDDIDYAPFLACPLTTVAQPKEVMGELAVKLLIENINNHTIKKKTKMVLQPELILRDSVKCIIKK
ncbi:LacI family DNA-binding transcriptional regulator [candidate division KSB1 bacterium]|nr:LacI family DNA-binding transcriptional regulator [candidate division KSB1 bacterium]